MSKPKDNVEPHSDLEGMHLLDDPTNPLPPKPKKKGRPLGLTKKVIEERKAAERARIVAEERAKTPEGQREQLLAQLKVAERLLKLKLAKDSLLDFAHMMNPDPVDPDDSGLSRYMPAAHHRLIAEALEKVERGEILRLAISMPPRHGKTEICTRLFPAWFMGRDPYRQTIIAGYSETFAEAEFGAKIRRIVESPAYRQVFPTASMKGGSKSVGNLVFTEGGNVASVGRGGAITGRGADLLIIDDPLKDREEADSALIRDKLWDWYTSTAYTRLMPGGRVVVIQTRWHEDDLIGRLVDPNHPKRKEPDDGAGDWVYLNIPAVFESEDKRLAEAMGKTVGDALWPERYPVSFMESVRKLNKRDYFALYQGRPYPDDGDFFKRADLVEYMPDELPAPSKMRFYAASDHALTTNQDNDASCLMMVGIDENDDIWVLPTTVWDRMETDQTVNRMIDLMKQHKPMIWWPESENIMKSIGPFLRKRMQEERCYTVVDPLPTAGKDKKAKARSIQGRIQMRKVRFPKYASWWPAARAEMLKFPNGAHDDFVDALAIIGRGLDREVGASREKLPQNVVRFGTGAWLRRNEQRDAEERAYKKATLGW